MPTFLVKLLSEPPGGHVVIELTRPNGTKSEFVFLSAELREPFDPESRLIRFIADHIRIHGTGKTAAQLRTSLLNGVTWNI